jgi:hypothetical protein
VASSVEEAEGDEVVGGAEPEHYRIRALLYAGKPNWSLLNQLTPP